MAYISPENKHIEEYLDHYCKSEHPPEYAVLLNGVWGAGKTWFAKKYCEKLKKNDQKYLYVSLYGITTFSEIEDAFFEQLHPILASKGMAIAGKLFKGVLKTAVKIDLDGDNKSSATLNSQIPEINLSDFTKQTKDCILFFDDLERCKMSVENVLGYINTFVEHQGLKVVIIGNEEEVSNENYFKIKEKLVGKTFGISTGIDDAIKDFIKNISNNKVRQFLSKNIEPIKHTYVNSKYNNLRQLKQSIGDFERLFQILPEKVRKEDSFLQDILQTLIALSFEIKNGQMRPREIAKFHSTYFLKFIETRKKDEDEKRLNDIIEKYSHLKFHEISLGDKCWQEFFEKGMIHTELLEVGISNSAYFINENMPNWSKLWHYEYLSDDDFETLLRLVSKEFETHKYRDIGVIIHVFGLLLRFSHRGFYPKSKDTILKKGKDYIKKLSAQGNLAYDDQSLRLVINPSSYESLGFAGQEYEEFQNFSSFLLQKMEEEKIAHMPDTGIELLEIMRQDVSKFFRMVCFSNSSEQIYYDRPILQYIDPNEFVETSLSLKPNEIGDTYLALDERYKHGNINKNLVEELHWLKGVREILKEKQKKRKGKLSGDRLKHIIKDNLNRNIKKLETIEASLNKEEEA